MGQVTKALQAVSASKVRRAQAAVLESRAYARAAMDVIVRLSAAAEERMHPLLTTRTPVENALILIITGDRGLCGAYNHNILQRVTRFTELRGLPVRYVTVGQVGRDTLWRVGADIVAEFTGLPAVPGLVDVSAIARAAIDEFLEGRVDEVYLAYTDFVNLLTQRPVVRLLLPLCPVDPDSEVLEVCQIDTAPAQGAEYIYEPDASTILTEILPRFTELQVYEAVLESHASEHAARMVAMRNATDNAADLAEDLTLDYNKARQRSITREILDIAGGAEALEQAMA